MSRVPSCCTAEGTKCFVLRIELMLAKTTIVVVGIGLEKGVCSITIGADDVACAVVAVGPNDDADVDAEADMGECGKTGSGMIRKCVGTGDEQDECKQASYTTREIESKGERLFPSRGLPWVFTYYMAHRKMKAAKLYIVRRSTDGLSRPKAGSRGRKERERT